MIATILKYLFIFYFCLYTYHKSLPTKNFSTFVSLTISICLSIFAYLLSTLFDGVNFILPLILFWIILSMYNSQPQLSFIGILFSFTISFCIYATSSFIIVFVTLPFLEVSKHLILLAFISGILQGLLIKQLFSFKRFHKGVPFLTTSSFMNFVTAFCLIFIGLTLYISLDYNLFHIQTLGLLSLVMGLAFLIYWWQAQITKSYRRSLEKRELESLRAEGLEKDALIEKLLQDNDRLATITHRDNTLISTLKNSTVTYLRTNFDTEQERIEAGERLVSNIESLSEGRASLQPKSADKASRTFDTGISLLDELLHYMDEEAIKNNIIFPVHIGVELKDFVPKDISENDLVHVIDDLLKNAFKATRNRERRMVQLQFYKLGKHFVVEVADNGIPFEIRSLVNMGIEKITTYEDGSGIGLVDIWNTKEKCRATYHLEEYATPSPFTKKISLTFDKKNRYSIRTYRKEEIQKNSKRIDLQIY